MQSSKRGYLKAAKRRGNETKKEEKNCKTAIKEAQSRTKGNCKQCNTNNPAGCVIGLSDSVSIQNHTRN